MRGRGIGGLPVLPEPDLPPLQIDPHWSRNSGTVAALPEERRIRLRCDYGLSEYDACILTESPSLADYYESVASLVSDKKLAAHWVMGRYWPRSSAKADMSDFNVTPEMLAELLASIESGIITGTMAKEIFQEMVTPATGRPSLSGERLRQVADEAAWLRRSTKFCLIIRIRLPSTAARVRSLIFSSGG